jgi:hypothetical protein
MRPSFPSLFAAVLLSLLSLPVAGAAGDLQITFAKHTEGVIRGKATAGNVAETSESVGYTIALVNNTSKDLGTLDVQYIIFVERQRIGEKKGVEVVDKVRGSAKAEAVKARQRVTVESETVKLSQSALQGNYYYAAGGRVKAQDAVKGLWIRAYQGDKMIGEYANPSTLATKEKWEK